MGDGGVVQHGDQLRGDLLADPPPVDRGSCLDQVGLQAVPDRLMHHGPPRLAGEHHREPPRRRFAGAEHHHRAPRCLERQFLGRGGVKELETAFRSERLVAGLGHRAVPGHHLDQKERRRYIVLVEFAQRVYGLGLRPGVAVNGHHLPNPGVEAAAGAVGAVHHGDLLGKRHLIGTDGDRKARAANFPAEVEIAPEAAAAYPAAHRLGQFHERLFAQPVGVGVSGAELRDHPYADAALRSGQHPLHLAVVADHRGESDVLVVDVGKIAPS